MSITLIDINCPHCLNALWYNAGDIDDITQCDVEVLKCVYCKKCFVIFEEVEYKYDKNDLETYADDTYKTAIKAINNEN
jgi:hypothetical protein